MHFNRRVMGWMFLLCGLLLLTVHYLAGLPFLMFAAVFLYYAPRWDLRIEVGDDILRFSENILAPEAVDLAWADLAEIRRVSEAVGRRNLLTGQSEYMDFVEFVMRSGKVWRMHDIFPEDLDETLRLAAGDKGVHLQDLGN